MLDPGNSTMTCDAPMVVLLVVPYTRTSSPTFSELLDMDFVPSSYFVAFEYVTVTV